MKSPRFYKLLPLSVFILLFLPIATYADEVPWSSELYTTFAFNGDYDTESGETLPLNSSVSSYESRAESSITDTSMFSDSYLYHAGNVASAGASFSGSYTAQANTPVFQFLYSLYYYDYNFSGFYEPYTYGWLTITDDTNNVALYSNNALPLTDSQSLINVNTTSGHIISVGFGIRTLSDDMFGGDPGVNSGPANQLTLNYSTAVVSTAVVPVVPEPISSILFLTGGSLLAGRRYFSCRRS